MAIEKRARNLEMSRLRKEGVSYPEIARKFGVSTGRVRDIVQHIEKDGIEFSDRVDVREVIKVLGLSYQKFMKKPPIKVGRGWFGGHSWVLKKDLLEYLESEVRAAQQKLKRCEELLVRVQEKLVNK